MKPTLSKTICSAFISALIMMFDSLPVFGADRLVAQFSEHRSDTYTGTLETICKKRFLRVLTTHDSFNFFIYQGEQRGYEYEIVKDFTKTLNRSCPKKKGRSLPLAFEMVPVTRDELIPMLLKGYGDIIAAGLTKTKGRKERILFSKPYNKVSEVLVSHLTMKIESLKDLAGAKISVRKSSSYYESLVALNKRLKKKGLSPISIEVVDEHLETTSIIELVALKKFDMTLADSHLSSTSQSVFENITVYNKVPFRKNAEIAWAVSEKSPELLKSINRFLPKYKKGTLRGNVALKKYFKNVSRISSRYLSKEKNQISPFDELLKKYGKKYNWDWRLLASLMFQESRFNQDIKNKWGAIGLFQVKEMVAKEPYINIMPIEGKDNFENNIHAGVKYLAWLRSTYFSGPNMSEKQSLRLTLAAYNAGPGRIRQARRLARKMGLNPNKWFRNVEYALITLRKIEPVKYVSEINKRFLAYSLLGIEAPQKLAQKK